MDEIFYFMCFIKSNRIFRNSDLNIPFIFPFTSIFEIHTESADGFQSFPERPMSF